MQPHHCLLFGSPIAGINTYMVISRSLNYTFITTPKCGTNTLFSILIERYEGVRVGDFHCRDLHYAPPGSFIFTICRNPFTRAVSIWWSTCMRGHDRYGLRRACGNGDDFETFITWVAGLESRPITIQNQTEWQRDIRFDRILRLESLKSEFESLPFVHGPIENFPELNTTVYNRMPARHYLTPPAVEAIKKWARPDFERFGYSADIAELQE